MKNSSRASCDAEKNAPISNFSFDIKTGKIYRYTKNSIIDSNRVIFNTRGFDKKSFHYIGNLNYKTKLVFIRYLFNIDGQSLQAILEKNLINLFKLSSKFQQTFIFRLGMSLSKGDIVLPNNLLKKIISLNTQNSHILLQYVKKPLMSGLNCKKNMHPIVEKLFKKTYVQSSSQKEQESIACKFRLELEKIISLNPDLATILDHAVTSPGKVFIADKVNGRSFRGYFFYYGHDIYVRKNIDNMLGTLIHELTHKAIMVLHGNHAYPFREGKEADFLKMQAAIEEELQKNIKDQLNLPPNNKRAQSWLEKMTKDYKKESHAKELLTRFTQKITDDLLGRQSNDCTSKKFTKITWNYLRRTVINPISKNDSIAA